MAQVVAVHLADARGETGQVDAAAAAVHDEVEEGKETGKSN